MHSPHSSVIQKPASSNHAFVPKLPACTDSACFSLLFLSLTCLNYLQHTLLSQTQWTLSRSTYGLPSELQDFTRYILTTSAALLITVLTLKIARRTLLRSSILWNPLSSVSLGKDGRRPPWSPHTPNCMAFRHLPPKVEKEYRKPMPGVCGHPCGWSKDGMGPKTRLPTIRNVSWILHRHHSIQFMVGVSLHYTCS